MNRPTLPPRERGEPAHRRSPRRRSPRLLPFLSARPASTMSSVDSLPWRHRPRGAGHDRQSRKSGPIAPQRHGLTTAGTPHNVGRSRKQRGGPNASAGGRKAGGHTPAAGGGQAGSYRGPSVSAVGTVPEVRPSDTPARMPVFDDSTLSPSPAPNRIFMHCCPSHTRRGGRIRVHFGLGRPGRGRADSAPVAVQDPGRGMRRPGRIWSADVA